MLAWLLLPLLTFVANSVILTLYFSAVIIDPISRATIHRDALKITFPGTIVGSTSILLNPILPKLMQLGPFSSTVDVGISIAGITWIVLTRRYCKTGLLSTAVIAGVAIILYLFITLFIGLLLLLLGRSSFPF